MLHNSDDKGGASDKVSKKSFQVVMLFAILVIISIIPVVILIVFGEDVYQLHAAKYTIVGCL